MWNPTGLDREQWAQVCKNSKMAGDWLTTKHHGGFCLWDSQHTDYDVASSPVKIDVVKAFTDAFRKAGLKIGLYYTYYRRQKGAYYQDTIRRQIFSVHCRGDCDRKVKNHYLKLVALKSV